eukprot:10665828-Heterocapsa_arctica.AAC.1
MRKRITNSAINSLIDTFVMLRNVQMATPPALNLLAHPAVSRVTAKLVDFTPRLRLLSRRVRVERTCIRTRGRWPQVP